MSVTGSYLLSVTTVFTYIGYFVVALLVLLILAALVFAALSGRVGKIETAFRRYKVFYPTEQPEQLAGGPNNEHWQERKTLHFSFWFAARAAKKTPGTRIFDRWDLAFSVVRPGWSERKNGYVAPRQDW
jgi:hypothetical protein